MLVYFNGQIIEKENVKISPDDRGFLFGDGIYEVIRAYNGKLFRGEDHFKRFYWNLGEVKINGADNLDYKTICEELLAKKQSASGCKNLYSGNQRCCSEKTFFSCA